MEFEQTRQENRERLLPRMQEVRDGSAMDLLEPFAKAYLGLYLNINSAVAPEERVRCLLEPAMADEVLAGLDTALTTLALPPPSVIGAAQAQGDSLVEAFIVLAALDRREAQGLDVFQGLATETCAAALCFHFAQSADHRARWPRQLVNRHGAEVGVALRDYWCALLKHGADALPGIDLLVQSDSAPHLVDTVLPLLLRRWTTCSPKRLGRLLLNALQYMERDALLDLARERLTADPQMRPKVKMLWLATAFFLEPEAVYPELMLTTGFSREKSLPLLDFVTAVMAAPARPFTVTPTQLAQLLRIIGPVFPPAALDGPMDDISRKVMALFRRFGEGRDRETREALAWLRGVRVMNACKPAMDFVSTAIRAAP